MNIREQVKQRLAAAKKTETAAVETAAGKPSPEALDKLKAKINTLFKKRLAAAGVKGATISFGGLKKPSDDYVLYVNVIYPAGTMNDNNESKLVDAMIRGKDKMATEKNPLSVAGYSFFIDPGFDRIEGKKADKVIFYAMLSETKKPVVKPKGKPASKSGAKSVSNTKTPHRAGRSTPKVAEVKAPKGTGKLKAFMKENGLDLKALKALVKHITPSK